MLSILYIKYEIPYEKARLNKEINEVKNMDKVIIN